MTDPVQRTADAIRAIEYDRMEPEEDDYEDTREALRRDAKAYYAEMRMDSEREG